MRKLTPEQFKTFIEKKIKDYEITNICLSSSHQDRIQHNDNILTYSLKFNSINVILPRETEKTCNELNIGTPTIVLKNDNGEYLYINRVKEIKYKKTTFDYEIVIVCEKLHHDKDRVYRLLA